MGRAPEIFGEFANTLLTSDESEGEVADAGMPPSTARDVRRLLKKAFRSAQKAADAGGTDSAAAANEIMFSALRRANDLSAVAFPEFDDDGFPDSLPIFDFSGSAVLPQEHSTFNFFEERYRQLALEITHETSGTGFFLLRGSAPSPLDDGVFGATVLLKVMKHTESADGQHACLVLGGPRVRVLDETEQPIEGGEPLARATKFEIVEDTDREDSKVFGEEALLDVDATLEALRLHCLYVLVKASALENLLQNGLPPLDPTRFSFWALRFVVGPVDTPSRINWLASQSTRARLQHTIDLCEEYLRVRAQAEAEGNRGNSENSGGDGGGGGGV